MTTLRRLFGYLRPHVGSIILAGICLVIALPAQLFHPLAWMFVVDQVVLADEPMFIDYAGGSRYTLLGLTVGIMIGAQLLGAGLEATRTWLLG
ncbi:MAG: hypothetical protein R3336_08165, partial [Phycisphaeraceae bacterium]|nr:hypothetical protein [Phycisphaeraceae bacterium]